MADGGVQVEWRGPGGTLELELSPDGGAGYLLTTATSGEVTYEEADASSWADILRLFTPHGISANRQSAAPVIPSGVEESLVVDPAGEIPRFPWNDGLVWSAG